MASIIIAVFNGERFIRLTVESVLTQTSGDYEVIVVDDGSTDSTPDILQNYGDRLRLFHQHNQGVAAARNVGLASAQGEYVVFLDADDVWEKDALATMLNFAGTRPHSGVIYAWHRFVDEWGNLLPEEGKPTLRGTPLKQLAIANHFPPLITLIQRSAVDAVGGLDARFRSREDWDLLLRLAHADVRFDYLPRFLACYRVHGSNKSSRPRLGETSQLAVLDKFYGLPGLPLDVVALAPQAYATVYLNSYIAWHQASDERKAYEKLRQGMNIWPEMLLQEDTYYRLVCADQPPGYRATTLYREPANAVLRITRLLNRLQADPDVAVSARTLVSGGEAKAMAHWTLSWFFHLDGDGQQAVRHLCQAAWLSPGLLVRASAGQRVARVLIGHRATQKLKRLARTLGASEAR